MEKKPYGDRGTVTCTGMTSWKYVAAILHIGGLKILVVFLPIGNGKIQAESQATEQPSLGIALLT